MKKQDETFEKLIEKFGYRYDLRSVFDDFLTLCLCAFSFNPITGKSHHEDMYLETIGKYNKDEAHIFSNMLAILVVEMENRLSDSLGNDVLGDYYEVHLARKGASQYFTPWPICMFMASCASEKAAEIDEERRLRVLDPCCGSGRMLLASYRVNGSGHEYYGIDIDSTCIKMATINLFLNGMFNSEIMCADALAPEDFKFSYRISFLPFGVFRIDEKEKSLLWNLHRESFKKEKREPKNDIVLPSELKDSKPFIEGTQLKFF